MVRVLNTFPFMLLALLWSGTGLSSLAVADRKVSFNYDIRPIMSDTCFLCHGPDEGQREAELRLDIREEAIADRDGSPAIVPGDPESSLMIWMINSDDEEDHMPPFKHPRQLTDREKELFHKWIEQGAEYEKHWSLIPPKAEVPDEVSKPEWVRNPVDKFILKRLDEEGLSPSKQADKTTLIRRVTFDLTGLPPTIEEIDAFLADERPDAYERLVDDLLSRITYAERMTNEWMDVARFSDSHGYSQDFIRDMSPYRDWVIEAFDQDMPYDQFVQWQLAGDLLPNATRTQKLATAFLRLHPQNTEGGIVNEEFKTEYAAERVQTIGAAFMGITMECSRCHDHKYDPISTENFYELFSFFNNIDDSGQISFDEGDMPVPTLMLPTEQETRMLAILDDKIKAQEAEVRHIAASVRNDFGEWKKENPGSSWDLSGEDALAGHFPLQEGDTHEMIQSASDPSVTGRVLIGANIKQSDGPVLPIATHGSESGILLNGDDPLYFETLNFFRRGKPFSVMIDAWIPEKVKEGTLFHFNKAGILYNYKGFEVSLMDGHWDVRMAHTFPFNSIHLVSDNPVAKEVWQRVALTYDGSSRAAGLKLYIDGEPIAMRVERDRLYKNFYPNKQGVQEEIALKVGARWRSRGLPGAAVHDLKAFHRRLTDLEVAHLAGKSVALSEAAEFDFYLNRYHPAYRSALKTLAELRTERNELNETIREVMVMDETPEPRQSYVLNRGVYNQPKQAVQPDTPEAILPFLKDLPRNRLGLAAWLVDSNNPLTARVTVNRYWQMIFGRGIVSTPEDFGNQGQLPTHPELLDWLARHFLESGWNVKELMKLIVTSATYQQTSATGPDLIERDPDNLLLARGPVKRQSAEMLRDNVLAASGLLVRKVGGLSVYPYQPEGLWSMNKGEYIQGSGEDLYRRSLYTVWKRTVPHPTMNNFDAPDRSYCVVKRQQTSSPLQALTLMNDPQFVEAARVLAERVMLTQENLDDRLVLAYRLLTSRIPNEKEMKILKNVLAELTVSFLNKEEKCDELLSVGEAGFDESLPRPILAAYAMVVSLIMNHDATVVLR
ncbi:MAG: DUF1553 domain-containing protein [Verrucomicrobiae bacterium]|nr:DUF1553 domain-containing protein [Verrucomicrobiae bacterium]